MGTEIGEAQRGRDGRWKLAVGRRVLVGGGGVKMRWTCGLWEDHDGCGELGGLSNVGCRKVVNND